MYIDWMDAAPHGVLKCLLVSSYCNKGFLYQGGYGSSDVTHCSVVLICEIADGLSLGLWTFV
jgi:hypothetical protein